MRLIDADALVESLTVKAQELEKHIRDMCGQAADYYSGIKTGFVNAAIVTDSFPTIDAAPTIEPIQCGKCIHHNAENSLCYYHNMPTTDGWFCADGERLVK